MTPPPIDEPTIGEVLRRIDALTAQVADLVREIKDDRAEAAATYVRRDVYMAERQAQNAVVSDLQSDIATVKTDLGREIKGVKDDRRTDNDKRRQMWLAIGGLAITSLIGIAGLVVNLTTR